ncbi:peptidase M16 [Marivirga tractuosa]|uniref:Peptidase M16 domain protein n=1 Tax=Marivirga tractuosa (strain ATCC 23168 / DSM 4126 / NBRC 15989 / NCIMB 1408 / VKM B-1430 / H-43) TaxID=643867 RepID=E4TRU5_MARTH|nr:pitrilysin family protein [Marivirga tractuosa]ADR22794.1 peptidase M16 domain protein [Marivirga tractuosa DSM 4126]BDD16535.1 peptidase M16 [Marivirga tractuosa]
MIKYNSFTLDNGLHVFVHEDKNTPLAVVNLLYDVGSRDEKPDKTGFAHLFEHLMFGGSKNIPNYDEPLQRVGGENNAFTSPDVTNYYITLPAQNIETAFWLESDRMLSLSFDPKVLENEKSVVIEEFKQRYLNQPYGDLWLKMRPLAYDKHPYQWATIGKEISHIENATMDDVKDFFFTHYRPNNAYLVVAGNVETEQIKELAIKWFGDIPSGEKRERKLPVEPKQENAKFLEIEADVPVDALYKAYHMPAKTDEKYYATDLMSDVLGRGKSSRLYKKLVKEAGVFSGLAAYVTGSVDPGLLVISGQVSSGISLENADKAVQQIIKELQEEEIANKELEKVKNQAISTTVYGEVDILNRAMSIAFGAAMGNPNLVNEEIDLIKSVSTKDIHIASEEILRDENCSTIYYKAKK